MATAVKEDVWIPTVCTMCYNMCTIKVHRVDGVAVKITGIEDAPPNHGKICAKGNAAIQSLYSPHRITKPMIRTNPKKGLDEDPGWKEITWDQALDIMTEKLRKVRADDPRKVFLLSFDGLNYLPLRSWCSGYGTNNFSVGSAGYFCGNCVHPVTDHLTGSVDMQMDLEHMDYCIMFGSQFGFVAQSHAMPAALHMADARARGLRLVVVDPVLSNAAAKADEWVPIRPGTDAALALGMANALVNELGLWDREYILRYTNGTYLVGADEYYLRDAATDKPLVWNTRTGRAEPFDVCPPLDAALEGSFNVAGAAGAGPACRPAFAILRENLKKYTPAYVEEVTTVPAATVGRLAAEFGRAARIGSTTCCEGETMPYRPACAFWYRGVSQHKHSLWNGYAIALLDLLVGAVDVPGGLLNGNAAGPFGSPGTGPDGFLVRNNSYTHMRAPWPPRPVKRPETLELIELFPVGAYARAIPTLGILESEKYKMPYIPEVLIQCRSNHVMTSADVPKTIASLKKIPYQISFADFMNETVYLADLVLPDAHTLERLVPFAGDPYTTHYAPPPPGGDWWFSWQQPVVQPTGQSRHWVEVLYEVSGRLGCLPDTYLALNALGNLKAPYTLDPEKTYTWEEMCDVWAKGRCGPDIDLAYFKQHGYWKFAHRTARESYPRPFHTARVPLYFEHFKKAGLEVKAVTDEMGIPWETDDYRVLADWRPCPSFHQRDDGRLWVINTKVPFYTHSITAENPLLNDLCERNAHVFPVGIHPGTARRLGISQGDAIVLESEAGKRLEGVADLRQGVHPEVLACPGVMGRNITGDPRIRGKGIHYNSLIEYSGEMMDYLVAAVDACVRVRVTRKAAKA